MKPNALDFVFLNKQKESDSNLYGVVLSTRYNPTAIWGKSDGIDSSGVALVSVDAPLLSDIPYLEICIQRARCKKLPKRMEVHRYTIGSVASKCSNN